MHLLSQSFQINSKCCWAESFEVCCQWALFNVQTVTLLLSFTVQKYIYPSVIKVHAGFVRDSIIHRTLTGTAWSLTCVCDHSYVGVYTLGLGSQTSELAHFSLGKTLTIFSCAGDEVQTQVTDFIESWVWCSANWATPSPQLSMNVDHHNVIPVYHCWL